MLFLPQSAQAQRHLDYCKKNSSTAMTLKCVNKHHKDVQEDLSGIFKQLLDLHSDEEGKKQLEHSQKEWISYRDAHCLWESGKAEADSLVRIYELSCLTQLTRERISSLKGMYDKVLAQRSMQFGAMPRWLNALAEDAPDVYWRYGDVFEADLNCDGRPEKIISGYSLKNHEKTFIQHELALKKDDTKNEELEAEKISVLPFSSMRQVIALSDNPVTGRPKAQLVELTLQNEGDAESVCGLKTLFSTQDSVQDDAANEKGESADGDAGIQEKACMTQLAVKREHCAVEKIMWDGKLYQLLKNAEDAVDGKGKKE